MYIGILGTGIVGQVMAQTLFARGYSVQIGTRDVNSALGRMDTNATRYGEPFGRWHQQHPEIPVVTFREAATFGEVFINATNGMGSLAALEAAGDAALGGKIMLDIANPLDFSQGMLPTLSIKDTDSLAEVLQRRFPQLRVVKTLNTMNVMLMVNPASLHGGDHTVFVSGDDAAARAVVANYLRGWFGWREDRILDLGSLETARGTEMLLPIWLRLFGVFGNAPFQFKVVS